MLPKSAETSAGTGTSESRMSWMSHRSSICGPTSGGCCGSSRRVTSTDPSRFMQLYRQGGEKMRIARQFCMAAMLAWVATGVHAPLSEIEGGYQPALYWEFQFYGASEKGW